MQHAQDTIVSLKITLVYITAQIAYWNRIYVCLPFSHAIVRTVEDTPFRSRKLTDSGEASKKVMCTVPHECRWGAPSPVGRQPVQVDKPLVCNAWPVRSQAYDYLPSCRASPPLDRYRIILLGDRGT